MSLVGLIALVWIISLIVGLLVTFVRAHPAEENKPCIMLKLVHPVLLKIIFWGVIPACLCVTIAAYCMILRQLTNLVKFRNEKKHNVVRAMFTIMQHNNDTLGMSRYKVRRLKEVRTTILMSLKVVFFVVCWSPGMIVLALALMFPCSAKAFLQTGVFMLYSFNATINPFLYAFHISTILKRTKQLWGIVWCKRNEYEEPESDTPCIASPTPSVCNTNSNIFIFKDFEVQV